jgi:nucleotide-binding universal stress UspA family protein
MAMKAEMMSPATRTGLQIKNILFATDFKHDGSVALPYALSAARRYESTLHVVHVVDVSPFAAPGPTSAMRAVEAQAIREAKETALEFEPALSSVPHNVVIRKGEVSKEIFHVVEQEKIDLIVLGTHGRAGVSKAIMGSVAEKIFRNAPCPVMTIGPRIHGEPDRFAELHSILVPCDFSSESAQAVSYAVSLALAHQARLYLVHVAPSDELPHASLRQALHNVIPPEADFSFAPKVFIEVGVPSQQILELAEEMAVDAIVLGVKPPAILKGTSTHQVMATAVKIVSAAGCPVITVRAPE